MKKPDQARVLLKQAIARRRNARAAMRRVSVGKVRRATRSEKQRYLKAKAFRVERGKRLIVAPEVMDLREHRAETIAFLSDVLLLTLRYGTPAALDFSSTKRVSPLALALSLAVIHRCRVLDGNSELLGGIHPIERAVRNQFQKSGFYKVLGVRHPDGKLKAGFPRDYIEFETNQESLGKHAVKLKDALLGSKIKLSPRAGSSLYRGITEAFNNAISHAYPPSVSYSQNTRRRWWLMGSFERRTRELHVIVVDLGVGIPRTIRKHVTGRFEQWLALIGISSVSDGALIQAATRLGATQTGQKKRGKGLPDLKRLIDEARGGKLRILSNRGEYTYTAGSRESVATYAESIHGTIIQWSVPLSSVSDWQADGDEDEQLDA